MTVRALNADRHRTEPGELPSEDGAANEVGCYEVDMVIDVAAARSGDVDAIAREVAAVRLLLAGGQVLKAIIEVPLLTHDQAIGAALAAERGGADIVETSTGFKGLKLRGTTAEDIRGLREVLRPDTGIEAGGGIRTTADAIAVIEAGATRIGTSSGAAILEGFSSCARRESGRSRDVV